MLEDKSPKLIPDNSDSGADSRAPYQVGRDFGSPALKADFSPLAQFCFCPFLLQMLIPGKYLGLQILSQQLPAKNTTCNIPIMYSICAQ